MKRKILLVLVAMLLSWYSLAQDSQDQSDVTAEPQSPLNEVQDTASDQAATEETTEEAEEDTPGRFIPSEQISQDLGVSFPIDI
ncbi:MAG: hypothetical protein O2948_03885 [Proteobacteria bacterium]|nr:hypothetical protein [Pseudomonadota bacterium]MDA0928259.1 hypothetical protein [Pseudomonadota bacterium]